MAVWNTKYINDLPDSSFAYIASGGEKDSDGKTTPRSLRKLPYKDADGAVDPAHVRNALARLDQTDGIAADEKPAIQKTLQAALAKVKADLSEDDDRNALTKDGMFRISAVELNSQGQVPTRIMLMQSGDWPNSVKGDFSISADDLKQIKENFDNGIGFPTEDASTGLAIDFKHEYADEAAGWIKGLELQVDQSTGEAQLFADPIEWTDTGAKAIQGGQFKCVSPSGWFGSKNGKRMSQWSNPTNLKEKIANVLDGAGLTNIPFLRGMTPIRASAIDENDSGYGNVIYVVSNQHKKEPPMNLDALRVKEATELSGAEYKFLAENKAELSAEEQEKFALQVPEAKEELSADDKALLDSIKSGDKKVIDKDEKVASADEVTVPKAQLDSLQSTADEYRDEKAQEVVAAHVTRGAIKQDSADNWKKRLLSATTEERTALEADLTALPDNEILKAELGTGENINAGSTAREQLSGIAAEKVKEAEKDGKELLFGDALKLAAREHPELQKQDLVEQGVA